MVLEGIELGDAVALSTLEIVALTVRLPVAEGLSVPLALLETVPESVVEVVGLGLVEPVRVTTETLVATVGDGDCDGKTVAERVPHTSIDVVGLVEPVRVEVLTVLLVGADPEGESVLLAVTLAVELGLVEVDIEPRKAGELIAVPEALGESVGGAVPRLVSEKGTDAAVRLSSAVHEGTEVHCAPTGPTCVLTW